MAASVFKAEDIANAEKLQALLMEIAADPSLVDTLPEAELQRIEKFTSPYTVPESMAAATDDEEKATYTCLSFTNLRKEYINKLITTAMVAYLYRRCDEYGRRFEDAVDNMDDMEAARAQVVANQQKLAPLEADIIASLRQRNELAAIVERDTAQELANRERYYAEKTRMTKDQIHELRDFASALTKNIDDLRLLNKRIAALDAEREAIQGFGKRFIIREFLDAQFRFNPDKHVRSSYATAAKPGGNYEAKFVPPDDFFHNFHYYMDSNHDELRGVANTLYRIKPDLDVGIIPYTTVVGKKEADKFIDRNKTSTIADILVLRHGAWNFLESFKANRDRIDAYRGTIVEDILNQVKSDTQLGGELVRKNVTKKRIEQVKQHGPEPKQVRDYMEAHAAAETTGVVSSSVSEAEQKRLHEEHKAKQAADESALLAAADSEEPAPHDTLRVNVYKFSDGGRNLDKSHFFTEAVPPDPNAPPSHHVYM